MPEVHSWTHEGKGGFHTFTSHFFLTKSCRNQAFPPTCIFCWNVKQISSIWSSFRLWTCTREARSQSNPCTEDWSTRLWMWRSYKRYADQTLAETIQRSCPISLSMFSCIFCSPTEHLRGEVQELWGVQGWRSAYCSQHSHSARRWDVWTTVMSVIYENACVHFTQVSAWPIPHSLSTVNSDQTEIARLLYNDTCHEVRLSKQLAF